LDFCWRAALNKQLCKGAISAADVNPLQALGRREPIEKNFTVKPASGPHHPFIGGSVFEAHVLFGHL
jgi:hypothetical protein